MNQVLIQLLCDIRAGGEIAADACVSLGLMLERERVLQIISNADGGLSSLLNRECNATHMTIDEVREVTAWLINYISQTGNFEPGAVWALAKACDPDAIPLFISLLQSSLSDPKKIATCLNAIYGIANINKPSETRNAGLAAIEQAAIMGNGIVREAAAEYLNHYNTLKQG